MGKTFNPYDKQNISARKIKELEEIIKIKDREISELKNRYEDMFRHMSNRCRAFTNGSLCVFCGYAKECKNWNGDGD